MLLLRNDIEVSTKRSDLGTAPSGCYIAIIASLIERVVSACATVVHDPLVATGDAVASPVLNHKREVIGVLYHVALGQFHVYRLHEAARTLGALLPDHPDDLPSRSC